MPKTFTIPKQELPYLVGRKLFDAKNKDGFSEKSWADYFTFIVNKTDITLQPNMTTALEEGAKHLFPMWMHNFAENLPYIRQEDSHSISELAAPTVTEAPKHSAIVVGRGPSIWTHKHLEVLQEAINNDTYRGLVVSSDGMLLECLQHDIIPDLTVSVDGSPLIQKWYDIPSSEFSPGTKTLDVALPVTINHGVYEICVKKGFKVHWFTPMFDSHYAKESITRVMRQLTVTPKHPDGLVMMSLGGNAGTAAWVFASCVLKASPVGLIGIDFGYPEGTKLIDTPYYSSMVASPTDIQNSYREVYHPTFKTKSYIDNVFTHYREAFLSLQYALDYWYIKAGGTINASEGGTLFGQGVKCMTFNEFLSKYKR